MTWDAINGSGSGVCLKGQIINNCDLGFQSSASVNLCYTCKTNYAVAYDSLSCVSYSSDRNCRRLNSDNQTCWYCWNSYYWDLTTCKLESNIFGGYYFRAILFMIILLQLY